MLNMHIFDDEHAYTKHYSRRFATATARTASLGVVLTPSRPLVTANDVGHWDQKHPKVLIVGKKNEEFDSHV